MIQISSSTRSRNEMPFVYNSSLSYRGAVWWMELSRAIVDKRLKMGSILTGFTWDGGFFKRAVEGWRTKRIIYIYKSLFQTPCSISNNRHTTIKKERKTSWLISCIWCNPQWPDLAFCLNKQIEHLIISYLTAYSYPFSCCSFTCYSYSISLLSALTACLEKKNK